MSGGVNCAACGYAAMATNGPLHAYMSPSAPCWALYGEVLAREFSDAAYWRSHRLLTDAYCAQHSVGPDRRARQSLHIHLAGLMLYFHDRAGSDAIIGFLKHAAGSDDFPALEGPSPDGTVTIEAIHGASDAAAHVAAVEEYARAVFGLWATHHGAIRSLIERVGI